MKRNKRHALIDHFKGSMPIYLTAFIVFVVGICLGAFTVNTLPDETTQELSAYLNGFFEYSNANDLKFNEVLKVCIGNNIKYILLIVAASFTLISAVLSVLLLGFKGFSIGFTVGFMIKYFTAKGAVFSFIAILPATVIMLPIYALIYRNCVRYAHKNFKNRSKIKPNEKRNEFFVFLLSMMIMFVILCVCSLIDSFVTPFIIKYIFGAMS